MTSTGCAISATSEAALCEGTLAARKAHARALVADAIAFPGMTATGTGRTLLEQMQLGCRE